MITSPEVAHRSLARGAGPPPTRLRTPPPDRPPGSEGRDQNASVFAWSATQSASVFDWSATQSASVFAWSATQSASGFA
eukprot:1080174-Prorocentrum_minimum.AAC.4